jgi:hypothetical protein
MIKLTIPEGAIYFKPSTLEFITGDGKIISQYMEWGNSDNIISETEFEISQFTKKHTLLKSSIKKGNNFKKMKTAKYYRLVKI